MYSKWNHANNEVADICRDAAEELRIIKIELEFARRELEIYRELNKSKIVPNHFMSLGWGKGKDE